MSWIFLCIAPLIAGLLVFLILNEMECRECIRRFKESTKSSDRPLEEPFSIADYYDRMMKVSEDLARQKAERKYEPTILWLLLDGLRINGDGTLEWVHKEKPKKDICIPPTPSKSVLYADNIPFYMAGVKNCSVEDRLRMQYAQLQSSLASQMAEIRNQVQFDRLITQYHNLGRSVDAYGRTFEGEPFYSWAQEL